MPARDFVALASALRAALTAVLRRGSYSLQAIPPADEGTAMRKRKELNNSFDVRSELVTIRPESPQYTTGLAAKVGRSHVKVSDDGVISAALAILAKRIVLSDPLQDTRTTRDYVAMRFAHLEHEVFSCLFLDNRNRVIACVELFRGSIDGAVVSPREILKKTLVHNASAVIFVHNHPSGVPVPTDMDRSITQRLQQVLGLIDVRVLDHLIVGAGVVDSMAERGLV